MNRPSTAVVFALAVALGIHGFAQDKAKKIKPKPDPHAVVKVDDEIRVVRKASLKQLKAEIAIDYKQAMKDYTEAVKEARKAKTKFSGAKPKKAKLKILKASCKDAEAANKFVAQLQEKERKKLEARSKPPKKKAPKKTP